MQGYYKDESFKTVIDENGFFSIPAIWVILMMKVLSYRWSCDDVINVRS